MNFALSDENILLRDSAANFLSRESDHSTLLVPGASVADIDYTGNWRKIVDLGWPSLIVPEALGGAGLGCVDLSVIVMEMGRTLFASPFAGHTFGTWAVQTAGTQQQQRDWLPGAGTGSVRFALVPPVDGNQVRVEDDLLSGAHNFVIDALGADRLVVAAQRPSSWGFYLVDATQTGVEVQLQPWRDLTRQVCQVTFDRAVAEPMSTAHTAWPRLLDLISGFLAAENVGGMRQVLEDTVTYANERVAFGRPIGSFQAIKHPLAEMLGKVESANAAALFSAWALQTQDQRATEAASMAKAFSSDAYVEATHRNIQIFGAIGFTWEMKNHLYYKRARGNAELFGNSRAHRDRVVNAATGRTWETGSAAPLDSPQLSTAAA